MKIRLSRIDQGSYAVIPLCGLSVQKTREGKWAIYEEGQSAAVVSSETLKDCREEIDSWRRVREAK